MQPNQDLLTTNEAAAYLRVSPETVRRWTNSDPPRLRFAKLPTGLKRFHRSDLDAVLAVEEHVA